MKARPDARPGRDGGVECGRVGVDQGQVAFQKPGM